MSKRLPQRFLGFVTAAAMAVAPFMAQPVGVSAASSGTLFAIASTSQTLVKVDLTTGAFTTLANLNTPNQPQSFALASDPQDHRLFAVRMSFTGFDPSGFPIFTSELLTIDSQTGAQIFNPAPTFSGFVPQALVFDTSTGTLFGLTQSQVVKVNPSSAALTTFANIPNPSGVYIYSMAMDSASHTLYLAQEDESDATGTNTTHLYSVNTTGSGAFSAGVVTDQAIRQIGVDSGQVYGITECCPAALVGINTTTGATGFIAAVGDSSTLVEFGTAADPATHTVFVNTGTNDPITGAVTNHLLLINDQTGAESSLTIADGMPSLGLAFETPPVITADTIRSDVRSARAGGTITSSGVAASLIAELNAAADARSRGQCATAANDYRAFINELNAQSGKAVAPATASQLIGEAQFLIANCP